MTLSRAGQLNCECAPALEMESPRIDRHENLKLSAGFGLSMLAQALVVSALPYAAQILAPTPLMSAAPYALWLTGALAATFPAALLNGLFGRRAAFALGASLGLGGGALAAWSFHSGRFAPLLIGALWLGLAQGFSLFYRHAAAKSGQQSLAALFGAGALAMLLAPALTLALNATGPLGPSALFGAASLISLAAMAIALTLPEIPNLRDFAVISPVAPRVFVATAAASACAWMVMTALMGATPMLLAGCNYGLAAATGLIAWHMLAMYLPAALLGPFAKSLGLNRLIGLGLVLLLAAMAIIMAKALLPIAIALTLAGLGWSLVTFGSMLKLYEHGPPARMTLASHDILVFGGAIAGAFSRIVWLS